jgi:hypothetical protein
MLSHAPQYHRASLLALRDAIVPTKTFVAESPFMPEPSVIFTAPPSHPVMFSAPPSSILYDSAIDAQLVAAFE